MYKILGEDGYLFIFFLRGFFSKFTHILYGGAIAPTFYKFQMYTILGGEGYCKDRAIAPTFTVIKNSLENVEHETLRKLLENMLSFNPDKRKNIMVLIKECNFRLTL